jgi:polyisoprenoid-binding protein YceI
MKIVNLFLVGGIVTLMLSFQSANSPANEKHQVVYEIDKSASVLRWKGQKNAAYFHTGTVHFSEGNMRMDHGSVVSGNFVVDLSSIACTDEGLPKEKQNGLAKHLKAADFFDIANYATAKVTIGAYKDGKLSTTINLLGVDVQQEVSVSISTTETEAVISGKFDVDFTAAKIPGTQVHEGDKESISPIFSFDLHLVLKVKK